MLSVPYQCQIELREDVEAAYPREACGILLGRREGRDLMIVRIARCGNRAPEPERRYSIDPVELMAAQKGAREEGLEILGFYHSHPDHSVEASETDRREAHWTECVYLICAVEKGTLAAIAATRLVGPDEWVAEAVHFEPPESQQCSRWER
ncbi:MAG TPA: M67 family metallopeptidase [Candidatus Saccharimonadales bacterium]|nr:M67 family metallopeptidase [Candidatus Saccharimonadales bacterium]